MTPVRTAGALLMVAAAVTFGGCGHNASLTHETATGGVATFSIQSDEDILSSVGRRDALALVRQKCPQKWRIVKEGELPKVSQAADRLWRGQMGTDRIWGIQFTCDE